jgi:hypothetical protein
MPCRTAISCLTRAKTTTRPSMSFRARYQDIFNDTEQSKAAAAMKWKRVNVSLN